MQPQDIQQVAEDQLAPEQTPEEMEEQERRRVQFLDEIGRSLDAQKQAAIAWRSQFESEWAESYQQFAANAPAVREAKDSSGSSAQNSKSEDQYRSTNDNITRSKVIITAARLGDMLFPTNDSNWTLEASPKPDIPDSMLGNPPPGPPDENGQPTPGEWTAALLVERKREIAKAGAEAMFNTIDDQFQECGYSESGRESIFDACLYGTGVLSGPTPRVRRKHAWGSANAGGEPMRMVERARPTVEHVDLWSFYPQPARSMDECEHVFRLHVMTPSAVRKLAYQPGFDREQVARLLAMTPDHGNLALNAINLGGTLRPDTQVVLSGKYSVWKYNGPMPKTAFAAFASGLHAQGLITEEESIEFATELESNPMTEIDCEVWVSQGVVLKMALSALEPGETGYYVYNYESTPDAIFGHGVPYLCRDDQRAANQLWHAIMLNSMMSAGPQIGVRTGALVQTNEGGSGQRSLSLSATKPRVWAMSDEVSNINEALSVFIIPNVTQQLMGVYDRAKSNADEHTMMPLIAQGEATSAVPTSSGMAMLMNAANVVTRKQAKGWDDNITAPLVMAFYCWNMAYNDDPTIKGDYCVIPKGSSHLLIKDIQAQHIQFATTLFANNPQLAPHMNDRAFAERNIEILDLSVAEMLATKEQVEQNKQAQAEQPNPLVLKAQADQATAEAAMKRATTDENVQNARIEFDRWDRELAHKERMADIDARERIQQAQLEGARIALVHKMAEMEADERVAVQRIYADLQKHDQTIGLKRYEADQNARIEAERVAQGDARLQTEVAVEAPNVRVA